MLFRFCSTFNCRRLTSSIVDLLFSVSSVRPLRAPLSTLCFHQLTDCFFLNSTVFNAFCVALWFFQFHPQKRNITMTHSASKPSFLNNSPRCVYFYPNGRRCRLSTTNLNAQFCPAHTRPPQNPPDPAEIASTLTANLDDFTSAAQINNFLSRLLLLLAQDKISTRRAAVLAYITNQLLRTLPAIDRELHPKEDPNAPVEIICDMPGPNDHTQLSPEPHSPVCSTPAG
jgi:hypothetical protein